jgi:hypothetical protein
MNVASAVNYSKDVKVEDNVVDRTPTRVVNFTYALSPSPLCKEKQMLEGRRDTSPSRNDDFSPQRLIERLRMEAPLCDLPFD